MMLLLLLTLYFFTPSVIAASSTNRIVCYYTNWAIYRTGQASFSTKNIPGNLCNYYIYSFVGINSKADVIHLDSHIDVDLKGFANFTSLKQLYPHAKFMLGMGDWNKDTNNYSTLVSSPTLRSRFVKKVLEIVISNGFDGFDLDWKYPTKRGWKSSDKNNSIYLLKELREAFDERNLLLSMVVSPTEKIAKTFYDIPGLSKYLDFINLMTYEFHSSTDKVLGANAPLYAAEDETEEQTKLNIAYCIDYWLSEGALPEKLNLGTAFHGKSYTLKDAEQVGRGVPVVGVGEVGVYTNSPGMLSYYEICLKLKNQHWKRIFDEEQLVPYAYKDDQIVSYDDEQSLEIKAKYAKKMKLGGVMVWALDYDDFNGFCDTKYLLLKTLAKHIRGINLLSGA